MSVVPRAVIDPASPVESAPLAFSADECWLGEWLGPSVIVSDARGVRLAEGSDPAPTVRLAGTVLPGFVDAHVHLGLVDGHALIAGGIAAVDDLGWDPAVSRTWAGDPKLPSVRFAGAFLTAPGGYPANRAWAPTGSVVEVHSPDAAVAAVDAQLAAGAGFIKITLNSLAGPVLDDATLAAVVARAHGRGTTVTAHTEGPGQAERAFRAGVDRLAHAPWNERLPDGLLAAMARSQQWISTLDIHGWGRYGEEFAIAQNNVRRFHAAGGRVRYGTDLGNGGLPLGINRRELQALRGAGIDGDELVAAISGTGLGTRLSFIPGLRQPDVVAWLAGASVFDIGDSHTPETV